MANGRETIIFLFKKILRAKAQNYPKGKQESNVWPSINRSYYVHRLHDSTKYIAEICNGMKSVGADLAPW